jgi:hypothetical protein
MQFSLLNVEKRRKKPLVHKPCRSCCFNYPASHLEVDAENFKFKTHLTPDDKVQKVIFKHLL